MGNKYFGEGFTLRIITIIVFMSLLIGGVVFSVYLFLVAKSFYVQILAVLFAILSILSGFFNFSASVSYYRSYFYEKYLAAIKMKLKKPKVWPSVAIVMPVYNESPAIVKSTFKSLFKMRYPKEKLTYYVLDDSTKPEIANEVKNFAEKNSIRYIHRGNRKGLKAGAFNNMLKHSKEEFIAIFDYDEKLINRNFLFDLMPYFADEKLSYVQTEKACRNTNNLFSDSVNLIDAFFFKFIEPARAFNNTAIFAGSCGVIRKSVLDTVGGFPEYVVEDTFFSFESDVRNYKSLYVPRVYAVGDPIRSFTALAKQQWRYNYGDTQFIGYFIKNNKKGRLTPLSNMDYITHGLGFNYISVILILFTILSIFLTFSSLPFENITIAQLLNGSFIPNYFEYFGAMALIMALLTPVILTKIYFNSAKKGLMLFIINFGLVFVRAGAAFAALFKMNPAAKWSRYIATTQNRFIYALSNSIAELSFSGVIIIFGLIALLTNHASGGPWLVWYGSMYLFTFILLYKYG